MTNMLINSFVPASVTLSKMVVTKFMRWCGRGRVAHQAELIELYTNPDFDIKQKCGDFIHIYIYIYIYIYLFIYILYVKHISVLLGMDLGFVFRYAQLLTTIFVTLIYGSGLPFLYFLAAVFMCFQFWADKVNLLWGSRRRLSSRILSLNSHINII